MRRMIFMMALAVLAVISAPVKAQNASNESQVVEFDKKVHDFGDILVTDGPQKCKFRLTNISDAPIVIHTAVSSCGCTEPVWSKEPIQPGKSTDIEVTFSNDQGPYPFNKSITLYISGVTRPVVLHIRGDVQEKKKPLAEIYTKKMGEIAFKQTSYSAGYITQGESKADYFMIANLSSSPARVEYVGAADSKALTLEISPNPIPAGSTATINYEVNTATGEKKWGRSSYEAAIKVNGTNRGKIEVVANITDNFNAYTDQMKQNAPKPYIAKSYYEFGEVKAGEVVKGTFKVSNRGRNDLIVYKIDSDAKGTVIDTAMPVKVKAGGEAVVSYKYDTSGQSGEVVNALTLVTNAPEKPTMNYFIAGSVLTTK